MRGAPLTSRSGGLHMSNNAKALAARPEILVIEDDPQIRRFLAAMLGAEGYRYYEGVAAAEGLAQASSRQPDLVLLDLGLPDRDGIEVIRSIRQWSQVPIIVISARNHEKDKIEALDAGADDYVSKPFAPGEVSARVRAALRRAATVEKSDTSHLIAFGNISVDVAARRVTAEGVEVHLTPNEYKLLMVLIRHSGRVLTQRHLLNEVWGPEHLEEREYLRVFMSQLRHKLEKDPAHPKHLITEPGIGYRLLVEDKSN
jgi:two-component system, OmpR family, KDP operon response regulator KdpE